MRTKFVLGGARTDFGGVKHRVACSCSVAW